MSIFVQNWVRQLRVPITTNEYVVLMELANYAHDDGRHAFPSMATIARNGRMSRPTVARVLDRLEHVHHLIAKEQSGKAKGTSNRYRILINEQPRMPAELEEGSPLDPVVAPVPNLFDGYPQGVNPDARGVYHGDAPQGVSPRARGVNPGARPGVSELDTQPINNHQEPSACAGEHRDAYGEPVACGADVDGCTAFAIPSELRESGMAHIAEIRERLATRSGRTDSSSLALNGAGS
jgi:hypothetical protein